MPITLTREAMGNLIENDLATRNVNAGLIETKISEIESGWIAAGETWTYASASTFTVAADVSGKYQKGDKIKLTQTTAKYFYVLSATYSAPNTTVTVTAGTSYTIANAAITLPLWSRSTNPFGFPDWFTYAPTFSAVSPMTFTETVAQTRRFRIDGKTCFVEVGTGGTTGGSAGPWLSVTVPVPFSAANSAYFASGCFVYDTVHAAGAWSNIDANTVRITKWDGSNWGIGVSRYYTAIIIYDLA